MESFSAQLEVITQEVALLGLYLTAGFILVSREWRSQIMSLLVQYLLVGFLLAQLVRSDIALLKVMIGAFICPVLFLSARQISRTGSGASKPIRVITRTNLREALAAWWADFSLTRLLVSDSAVPQGDRTNHLFRLSLTLMMILVATVTAEALPLPNSQPNLIRAVYWLIFAGLSCLTLTEAPLKAGLGLLTVLTGFDLYYTTIERSFVLTAIWGSSNLLIALVIGYLIIAHGAKLKDEWS